MSQIKIVATIGPSTNHPDLIRQLVEAGLDVARLNGAHADLHWHSQAIDLLRRVAPEVPILLDLPGSKVRARELEHELSFDAGDRVIFTTSQERCDAKKVPVSGASLHQNLAVGDVLSADDGAITFTVLKIVGEDVICQAQCAGTLSSGKGITLPPSVRTDQLTDRDREIIDFAKDKGVDFVGVSFVSCAEHVERVGVFTGKRGPRIIAKIETQEGLDHLEAIAASADGLLVDRGDLSVQTSLETMILSQKRIVEVARATATPVIIATEMLHSMIENPNPTKAEVCDISNAVLDGASALMLSGETAIGKFPVQAVSIMRRIAAAVADHDQVNLDRQAEVRTGAIPPAMSEAVSMMARRLPVTKIVAITIGGYAARMVAASRPRQPILAVSNDRATVRSLNLLAGTEGVHVEVEFKRSSTDHIAKCLEILWRRGKVVDEDLVLVTSLGYPRPGNRMNMIQMHSIADLAEALQWKQRSSLEGTSKAGPA